MTKVDLDALEKHCQEVAVAKWDLDDAHDYWCYTMVAKTIPTLIAELRAARAVVDVARVAFGLRNVPGYAGDSMLDVGAMLVAYDATVQP